MNDIYNKKLGGDSMVTIGETLGKYRRAAGLSQKEALQAVIDGAGQGMADFPDVLE